MKQEHSKYKLINISTLNKKYCDDKRLVSKVITIFLKRMPELKDSLSQAVVSEDYEKISISAHSLKGALGNFYVDELVNSARKIEFAAREQESIDLIKKDVSVLMNELAQLEQDLSLYLNS